MSADNSLLFDPRTEVLEVRESPDGVLIVSTQEKLALAKQFEIGSHATIRLLPDLALGAKTKGLINVSIAPLRSASRHAAEQVSQLLMGHEVSILERANADWYRVKGWDGYLGFIHKEHVLPANPCWNTGYGALNKFAVSSNYAQATVEPYEGAQPIFDVSAGCLLGAGEVKAHDGVLYRMVYTPDMRQGYLQSASLIPTPPDHFVPADLIPWILKWMGTPYLWGGCSPRGFDCSGLVQLAGLLCNQRFPRDASQQVFLGKEIPSKDAKDLSPGDLLFFGEIPTKITHVAVYEGDGRYLHAAGRVRRNSLNPLDADFEAYRFQTWQQTRRLV